MDCVQRLRDLELGISSQMLRELQERGGRKTIRAKEDDTKEAIASRYRMTDAHMTSEIFAGGSGPAQIQV